MSMRYPGGLIAPTPVNQQFPSGVWTGPQSAPYQANNVWANDSSFKNTTLLLHGDGATTPFIKDASTNNFQITLNGDTKPNNLTPFITNGYWSNYFDGSGDYLSVSSNTAFDFAGDFTVEGYFYFLQVNQVAGATILFNTNVLDRFQLAIENNVITLRISGSLVINTAYTSASLLNTWTHIAAVRTGSTVAIFVNGTRLATGTSSATPDNSVAYIGVQTPGYSNHYFNGYMSSLRVVNGSGPYNATQTTLTVPTSPLTAITNTSLLTCQSNRFVDNSTNALAITVAGDTAVSMQQPFTAPSGTSLYGSGYFDGNGDGITTPASSAFAFGTGDFTYEGWYYSLDTGSSLRGMFDTRITQASTAGVLLREDSSGFLVYINGGTLFTASGRVPYSWQHIALVRNSGTIRLYVNGVQVNSAANTTNFTDNYCRISGFIDTQASPYGYYGYISNARVINGTCLYPSGTTFTPSTTPLTPVSGTSLLTLQTNGPATNNGFLDSSYNSFPVTRNGNTTQGSFNPYQTTGYWSNYFDGSGDYLTIPSSSTFSFTGSFTWEAWVYLPVTTSGAEIVSKHVSGVTGWYMLAINSSLNVNFVIWDSSNNASNATTSGAVTLGAWNHIAGGRNGSTVFACLNGVYTSAALTVTPRTSDAVVTIGINANGSASPFNGYISNLRAVSAAVYTGNYTVPTAPLTAIASTQLLTCQSNRFKDNSSNAVALTSTGNTSVQIYQPFTLPALQYTPQVFGGSGYFDGSGDYFTVPTSNAFNFTGDATCECWIYPNALSTNSQLFGFNNGVSDLKWIGVLLSTSGAVSGAATAGAGGSFTSANGVVGVGRWHHIAWVKNGATVYLYVNGVQVASGASSAVYAYQASPLLIGRLDGNNSLCFNGYMADMRIVKTAVYTSAFTPPTAPLTPIANTQLLLSMTNAAIFDNSSMNNMETAGDSKVSTAVTKYGTGSMYFDGSGDYLLARSNDVFNFGTGDFTVEFWINASASGSYTQVIGTLVSGTEAGTWRIGNRFNSLNQIYFARGTGSGFNEFQANVNVNDGAWHHVAVTRLNGIVYIYVDGIQSASSAISGTCTSSNPLYVGYNGRDNAYMTGYIDDLRITKGVARYVGNFTPPVARMPNQ